MSKVSFTEIHKNFGHLLKCGLMEIRSLFDLKIMQRLQNRCICEQDWILVLLTWGTSREARLTRAHLVKAVCNIRTSGSCMHNII